MKILSVASEIYPIVKTGGLADVVGALPPALAPSGVALRNLVPGYPAVMRLAVGATVLHEFDGLIGAPARLLAATVAGLDLIVLDAPELFDRPGGLYVGPDGNDHADNWRRFGALSLAAAEIADGVIAGFRPDILHAHDWQAALAPAHLRFRNSRVPSVMTVHNLAFQGHFPAETFQALGLPPEAWAIDGVEYYGGVGFLKAGLASASAITTVSPTYAAEITTPTFGMGLDGLIRLRADVLHGIVNGIDTAVWNPEADGNLASTYSARRLAGRAKNRRTVEAHFGLDHDRDPLFVVVSRLTWQKGIDLLVEIADEMVGLGVKLAVLGTGDPALEGALLAIAGRHPGRVGVTIGYDEPLAHQMQGGGDAILIPSRFEPCGLTQLYGLRYGCVPVVARTGGLADTVIDANIAAIYAGTATGVQFTPVDATAFQLAIRRTLALFRDSRAWTAVQRCGMRADVSWQRSAADYAALYASLLSSQDASA